MSLASRAVDVRAPRPSGPPLVLHASTEGLDVAALRPGEAIVLDVPEADGVDLAEGAAAVDHLDDEARRRADDLALDAYERWCAARARALTIDGVSLPFVRTLELWSEVFVPVVRDALGLRAAVERWRPARLEPAPGGQAHVGLLAAAVGAAAGIPATKPVATRATARPFVPHDPTPALVRLRRRTVRMLADRLLPRSLRPGSVLIFSYWPVLPLLDRLLADRAWRPAIALTQPPTAPARSLRALRRGGALPRPPAAAQRRAEADVAAAIAAARAGDPPPIEVDGLALGACLDASALDVLGRVAAGSLARARTWRPALAAAPPRTVVVASDLAAEGRLAVMLAREAGARTVVVQHGAFFLPSRITDLTVADRFAVWSHAVTPRPPDPRDCVVGHPVPASPAPLRARRPPGAAAVRVAVLSQAWHPSTARVDSRALLRHYVTAVAAIRDALPGATAVLRPHPADDRRPLELIGERFAGMAVEIDARPDLLAALGACDVCVAGASTATLQAPLAGTPLVVLNVTGVDWQPPLGGATSVPVARSSEELVAWLRRWHAGEELPGRDALLAALGVDGGDPVERLLELL